MKLTLLLAALTCAALFDSSCSAQSRTSTCGPFTSVVTPYPAPRGVPISVTITNTSSGVVRFNSSCIIDGILQGSPQGRSILGFGCNGFPRSMQPGERAGIVWDQLASDNLPVAAGDYLVVVSPVSHATCYVPMRIEGCRSGSIQNFGSTCRRAPCFVPWRSGPELHVGGCPEVGSTLRFYGRYLACDSFHPSATTLLLGGDRQSWNGLSLPLRLPGGCALQTSVDLQIVEFARVGSVTFDVPVPPLPALRGSTVHAQVVQLDLTNGMPLTTNGASVTLY